MNEEEKEILEELLNNEIYDYMFSGYSVTSDYIIKLRKIIKKLELNETYNFDKMEFKF